MRSPTTHLPILAARPSASSTSPLRITSHRIAPQLAKLRFSAGFWKASSRQSLSLLHTYNTTGPDFPVTTQYPLRVPRSCEPPLLPASPGPLLALSARCTYTQSVTALSSLELL